MEQTSDPPEDVKINLNPTERRLLNELKDGKRQTPKNLSAVVGDDVTRNYTANALRMLEKKGYTKSPGPADRSGMYTISDLGRIIVDNLEVYTRDFRDEFDTCCRFVLANQPTDAEEVRTDILILGDEDFEVLRGASEVDGLVTGEDLTNEEMSTKQADRILYRLFFFGLLEQRRGFPVYEVTTRGEQILSQRKQQVVGKVIEKSL
ncbi:hypothetical protein ACFQMA_04580 [Halosimplex aquaticum]|uniref:Uncharacterized protein n=1 Tax=Halosimplex aquaticum TaxID=3026162 RepID=A0ABD5XVC7_9EURY|nr:hypothetical protein [Halosimplex aquaticum]